MPEGVVDVPVVVLELGLDDGLERLDIAVDHEIPLPQGNAPVAGNLEVVHQRLPRHIGQHDLVAGEAMHQRVIKKHGGGAIARMDDIEVGKLHGVGP